MPAGSRGRARLISFAAAAGLFLLILVIVERHPGPLPLDRVTHRWALQHRAPIVGAARLASRFGTGPVLLLAVLAAGIPLARKRRRWELLLAGPLLLLAAQLVRFLVVTAVARQRPPRADWSEYAGGLSFPSGHTTSSAVGYGLVLLLLAPQVAGRGARLALSVALVGLAAAIGVSRVILGVHWATDVFGGWTLALALLVPAAALLDGVTRAGRLRLALRTRVGA